MIDVLLVLIIIFMVIAPKVPTGLPVMVPQPPSRQTPEPPKPDVVVAQVLQNGKIMINEEASESDAPGARLADIFKERADEVAFVKGADEVRFERVKRAIDIMQGAGIDHVGLMTARMRWTARFFSRVSL